MSGVGSSGESKPTKRSGETARLGATAEFNGTQFTIRNADPFAWSDVKIMLNSGFFDDGFYLKASRIEAQQTYKVGALQFANSQGTRFNGSFE